MQLAYVRVYTNCVLEKKNTLVRKANANFACSSKTTNRRRGHYSIRDSAKFRGQTIIGKRSFQNIPATCDICNSDEEEPRSFAICRGALRVPDDRKRASCINTLGRSAAAAAVNE